MGDDCQSNLDDGHAVVVVAPLPTTLRATALPPNTPTVASAKLVASLFAPATYKLMLAHDCANAACHVAECHLCARAARKRCSSTTMPPVIDGGVCAPCGAAMSVDVMREGRKVNVMDAPPGTCVHFFLVNGDAYDAAVVQKDWAPPHDDVVPAFVTVQWAARKDKTVYHMLPKRSHPPKAAPAQSSTAAAGPSHTVHDGASHAFPDGLWHGVPDGLSHAVHDDVSHAFLNGSSSTVLNGSSSTVLNGLSHALKNNVHPINGSAPPKTKAKTQPGGDWNVRPVISGRVRLIAVLVDASTGELYPHVTPAVSEPFVVHTQPKRLIKTKIARMVDLVTVLPGIGVVAANRLSRLAQLTPDIVLPPDLHSIHTVGDMKQLAACCACDQKMDDAVRNALSLARSVWSKAKHAAAAAVEPDSRLRAFHTHAPTYATAVFDCTDGIVNLSAAAAVLVAEGGAFKLVDVGDVMFDLASLVTRARVAWFQPGHPGWDLVTCAGGRTFNSVYELRSYMAEQVVESAPMLL